MIILGVMAFFFYPFRAYDPADYEHLPVSQEIKELFHYITRYVLVKDTMPGFCLQLFEHDGLSYFSVSVGKEELN